MGHQPVGAQGVAVTRAALTELLARLRRAAVDGVVPDEAFAAQAHQLGLGDAERERLREELARLGVPVERSVVHADIDRPDVEKVAWKGGENVFARLAPVRALLLRYADDDGYVTTRLMDGVVRLAGLDRQEETALRAWAKVRDDRNVPGNEGDERSTGPGSSSTVVTRGAAVTAGGVAATAGADEEEVPDSMVTGAVADAVKAALAVLRADRFERRPENRLLSAEAEVGLAVLIRGGAERIGAEPSEDELKTLPRSDLRIRARDCLVVHNLRLVHSLIRPYLEQGLDYDDLFQHGCLGLMKASRKFDPSKGYKFSTYATWWVRQSLGRGVDDEGALIRIPVHMKEQIRKVAHAERTLAAQGRPATAADVAVLCDLSLKKVEEARRLSRRTDSLDRVMGDGATLADFVAETHTTPSLEKQVVGALYVDDVLAVVDTFTEREARILVRRLGLDGDEPSTLDDLGREFGVTRERIRQIEGKTKPVLLLRLREAGLVNLDAACERAEREAERAAQARKAARIARATHAARTARVRLALRKATAEHLVLVRQRQADETASTPVVGTEPAQAGADNALTDSPAEADATAEPQGTGATSVQEQARTEAAGDAEAQREALAADWERARRLAEAPVDQDRWLVDYARAALGNDDLTDLLGQPADVVARDARNGRRLSRPVLTALEVLRRVFDALVTAGQQPGDFFDRPTEALVGATPRDYLVRRPLTNRESRLAVRDALREFLAVAPAETRHPDTQEVEEEASAVVPPGAQAQPEPVADTPVPSPSAGARDADTESPQATADWGKALALTEPPLGGGVAWRAEYALLALGHLQLSVLLGTPAADAVVRAARHRGTLDRPVVQALETLVEVFTAVRKLGLRPEHFFESLADRLAGATPRGYLAANPLVHSGARLAISDALREFVAALTERVRNTEAGDDSDVATTAVPADEAEPGDESPASASVDPGPNPWPPAAAELPSTGDHDACEGHLASVTREHERRRDEERSAADERVAAVRTEVERELDAWEEVLFARMDALLLRRERRIRAEAEERVAQLKAQHHAAYQSVLHRAQKAEATARPVQEQRDRTAVLELRLRQYREGAETRIADLESRLSEAKKAADERERAAGARVAELETRVRKAEAAVAEQERAAASAREEYRQGARLPIAELEARLRDAEAALEQRDRFVEAARRHAEEAEQQAAQRIAQSEHSAWLRITDLQTQLNEAQARLAATQEAERSRGLLRDRWRRSS
ncbi:sigma-70 family RNA polymerase sigma factor [Streptomyces sp. NPDC047085]|uniref:sigma-70 family RNA polymerase sigma factor n=1 Tax=Streptomyces sp. NPDC047085 TaxID=3155140 RepID=UPI0033F149E4